MAHGKDKGGKEKRKPKKDKSASARTKIGSEVLDHVAQHGPATERSG